MHAQCLFHSSIFISPVPIGASWVRGLVFPSSSQRPLYAPDFVVCWQAYQERNIHQAKAKISRQQKVQHFLLIGASNKPTGQPLLCRSEQGTLSLSFWDQVLYLKEYGGMKIMSTGERINFKEEGNIPTSDPQDW